MAGSNARSDPSRKRCAVYTRKSSEEGSNEFNSLAAQRELARPSSAASATRVG